MVLIGSIELLFFFLSSGCTEANSGGQQNYGKNGHLHLGYKYLILR